VSAREWVRLSDSEARELLNRHGRRVHTAHHFSKRICHWLYCKHCGLVLLRNEPTRYEAQRRCIYYED
jgi:hypothetical protein